MKGLLLLVGMALPGLLHAQPVPFGLSVDRDDVRTQQTVKVVVNFGAASRWCGLRVDFGDGDVREILVDDFPLILTKQYASAGRYVLRAKGRFVARGLSSSPGCVGAPRALTVVVGEAATDGTASRPDPVTRKEQRGREWEDRREAPNRDRGVATVARPVPAATPRRVPAPSSSKPRDGTLKVF